MATKIQRKNDIVYRGINLFENEIQTIIASLQKAKMQGSKDIIDYLKRTMENAEEE